MNKTEELRNETEAEGLMVTSFKQSIREGRELNPKSLETRLEFRSLQSLLWVEPRRIEEINNPLGLNEGFSHGMSVGLGLTNELLTHEQAASLLKAPIQIKTLSHWLAGESTQDHSHYFSAMAALYAGGHFGENTLAETHVQQALYACQAHAEEWLDADLIASFEAQLAKTSPPKVEWDSTDSLFQPQFGTYLQPSTGNLNSLPRLAHK